MSTNKRMAIQNQQEKVVVDGEEQDALVLTITNSHKSAIERLVDAYKVKEKDEAKLIAFLIATAGEEGVIGRPIGANGRFFSPPDEWVEKE